MFGTVSEAAISVSCRWLNSQPTFSATGVQIAILQPFKCIATFRIRTV